MACNRVAAFFVIALLSAAATHAETGLSVSGRLCCTDTGNCPGKGLSGQVVRLSCHNFFGLTTTVGETTTNADGGFLITARNAREFARSGASELPCIVSVLLPVDGALCPALSTTDSVLESPIRVVDASGTVVSGTPVGFSVVAWL